MPKTWSPVCGADLIALGNVKIKQSHSDFSMQLRERTQITAKPTETGSSVSSAQESKLFSLTLKTETKKVAERHRRPALHLVRSTCDELSCVKVQAMRTDAMRQRACDVQSLTERCGVHSPNWPVCASEGRGMQRERQYGLANEQLQVHVSRCSCP
eukprot:1663413-Amphidinium_carterae.2